MSCSCGRQAWACTFTTAASQLSCLHRKLYAARCPAAQKQASRLGSALRTVGKLRQRIRELEQSCAAQSAVLAEAQEVSEALLLESVHQTRAVGEQEREVRLAWWC